MSDVLDPALLQALGLAFTGQAQPAAPAPMTVDEWFASIGWPADKLVALRSDRQLASQPWPFEVPADVVRPIGFARFLAVLKQARTELGLDGLQPKVHQGPKVIGPAEQRLMAERPPHHGNVG